MANLQIVVVGNEWDRILKVLKKYPCEKAVFITSGLEKTRKEAEKLAKAVSPLMDTEIATIHYRDLELALAQLKELIEKNIDKYEKIYVNISGGTKIISIAFMLLSQYYPLSIVYAVPEYAGEIKSKKTNRIIELPTINFRNLIRLSKTEKEIIRIIGGKELNFTELVQEYAKKKNIALNDLKIRDLKSRFSYTLKMLKEKSMINTEIKDKRLIVCLSPTGKFITKIYGA